jgi:hypothetical protein
MEEEILNPLLSEGAPSPADETRGAVDERADAAET